MDVFVYFIILTKEKYLINFRMSLFNSYKENGGIIKVTKAVIPAARLGTRVLSVTKVHNLKRC